MKDIVLLLIVFVGGVSHCLSQESPKIRNFSKSHYGAASQNWQTVEDCNGNIFVANTEGVLMFNGFSWRLLKLPNGQRPRAVYTDDNCVTYVGGYEFFGKIVLSPGGPAVVESISEETLLDSGQEIWQIFGNEAKIVFQSFSNVYTYQDRQVKLTVPPTNVMLGEYVNGNFLIPKINQGLYLFDGDFQTIQAGEAMPIGSKVSAICSGGQDKVVIATQFNGLYFLENEELFALNTSLNQKLKSEEINDLVKLSNGNYAVGTILNGIYILDSNFNKLYHVNKSNGLLNNTVLDLFEDQYKNLWISLDKGISVLNLDSPIDYYYDVKGVLGTVFTSTEFRGDLYVGSNQGAFRRTSAGEFELVENSLGQCWSFLQADGKLLLGHNKGTYQLDKNGEFELISDVTGGWHMVELDSAKSQILQSTYTGLVLLNQSADGWQFMRRVANSSLLIMKFVTIQDDLIGYHPNYGLCHLKLSPSFDTVISQQILPLNDVTLSRNPLLFAENNNAYVFDRSEVYHIDLQTQELQKLTTSEKELSERTNTWLNAVRAASEEVPFSNFTFCDVDFNKAELLLGADEGYVKIDIDRISKQSLTPIQLEHLAYSGEYYPSSTVFGPNENDITIQLRNGGSLIDYANGTYHLEGWNDRWLPIPPNGQLNFLNLDDGDYALFVSQGDRQTELTSFSIKPHWYESWLGYLLYAGLVAIAVYLLNRRNKAKLRKEKAQLQEKQAKALESERIKAKNASLEQELLYKSKMLANSTMTLVQKNKMLNDLKAVISSKDKIDTELPKQKIFNLIDRSINSDTDWKIFEENFAAVHKDFLDKLKNQCQEITGGELRLAAYIKMNLSSKEIAPLLNISVRSVENKRYRLRKKLNVPQADNLNTYLMRL